MLTCIYPIFGSIIPISLFILKIFFSFLFVIFVQLLKIIGIKVCYYLIKIFSHNKIHFKINSII